METKGTILSYRPDVRVVDATIRDGGLVNDFRFTDEFVKNLYKANIKAGAVSCKHQGRCGLYGVWL